MRQVELQIVGVRRLSSGRPGGAGLVPLVVEHLDSGAKDIQVSGSLEFRESIDAACCAAQLVLRALGVEYDRYMGARVSCAQGGIELIDRSYGLPIAAALVASVLGTGLESRVCATGILDREGTAFGVEPSGISDKARACQLAGVPVFISPLSREGSGNVLVYNPSDVADGVLGMQGPAWPFSVAKRSKNVPLTLLESMLTFRSKVALYPRGLGAWCAKRRDEFDWFSIPEWLLSMGILARSVTEEDYRDYLQLMFLCPPELQKQGYLLGKLEASARSIPQGAAYRRTDGQWRKLNDILEFLALTQPRLIDDAVPPSGGSKLFDYLDSYVIRHTRSLEREFLAIERIIGGESGSTSLTSEQIFGYERRRSNFDKANPDFADLRDLSAWIRERTAGLEDRLAKIATKVANCSVAMHAEFRDRGGLRFSYRCRGVTPDPRDRLDDPVALVENPGASPATLQSSAFRANPLPWLAHCPNREAISERFFNCVQIAYRGTRIFWADEFRVWPPSIDCFYLLRMLDVFLLPRLSGCERIADVGAGTGVLGLHLARHTSCRTVDYFDIEPNAEVFCYLNWNLMMESCIWDRDPPQSRFFLGDACINLQRNAGSRYDLLISAVPYLPYPQRLATGLWSAIGGIHLAKHLLRNGHEYAKRIALQYSSIAGGELNKDIEAIKVRARRFEIRSGPYVAFKIPTLEVFFDPRVQSGALYEAFGKPYLESLQLLDADAEDPAGAGIARTGGFRYFHQLKFLFCEF